MSKNNKEIIIGLILGIMLVISFKQANSLALVERVTMGIAEEAQVAEATLIDIVNHINQE